MRARNGRWVRALLIAAGACLLGAGAATSTAADSGVELPTPGEVPVDVQEAVDGRGRQEVVASLEGAATGPGLTAECTAGRLGFGTVRQLFEFTVDAVPVVRSVEAQPRWLVPVLCGDTAIGVLWVSKYQQDEPAEYENHRWRADLGQQLIDVPPGDLVVEHRYSGCLFAVDPVDESVRQLLGGADVLIDGEVQLSAALPVIAREDARLRAEAAADTGPDDYRALIFVLGVAAVVALVIAFFVLRSIGRALRRSFEPKQRPEQSEPPGPPLWG